MLITQVLKALLPTPPKVYRLLLCSPRECPPPPPTNTHTHTHTKTHEHIVVPLPVWKVQRCTPAAPFLSGKRTALPSYKSKTSLPKEQKSTVTHSNAESHHGTYTAAESRQHIHRRVAPGNGEGERVGTRYTPTSHIYIERDNRREE